MQPATALNPAARRSYGIVYVVILKKVACCCCCWSSGNFGYGQIKTRQGASPTGWTMACRLVIGVASRQPS